MMDFETFVSEGKVKKQAIDSNISKSLKEQAERRMKIVDEWEITEENRELVLEECYEVMRSLTDALLAFNGYKSYSHEASIAFLAKDKTFSVGFIEGFDRLRKLRHGIKYYGERVSISSAKEAKLMAKALLEKLVIRLI